MICLKLTLFSYDISTMEKDALAVVPHPHEGEIVQTNTAPQVTMIHELKPTSHGKILEARVYKKWTAITYGKKT